jgi:molybdopterin synthase catalytic subunit
MNDKTEGNIFVEGPIPAEYIATLIQQYGLNKSIGAYSIFMGQVRRDEIDGSKVAAIEFTTQAEMASDKFHEIQASLFEKYKLTGLTVYHSLGKVNTGEICLFVLTVSAHRAEAIAACSEAVELVKSELPVWGKLILENEAAQWKENN